MSNNGMLKYTSRDYNSIMEEFWDLVPKLTDLWKPEADADPGVVLGKYLASIADMLGVNLDIQANELYAPSVTQRKNAEKIFGLCGYKLGWYTAARTEVTITNISDETKIIDFGFNGGNFSTVRASTDIAGQPREIIYQILPTTNSYGNQDSRSVRTTTTSTIDVFSGMDSVTLIPGGTVTREAVEGELRQVTISVSDVKNNNYLIKLPSQHIDTTAIWLKAKSSLTAKSFIDTRWRQVDSVVEFNEPEPLFAVTYDNYGNAQIEVSNYLNEMDNYESNYFVVYWIDCSGVIGSVSADVLGDLQLAIPSSEESGVNVVSAEELSIINLANTIEVPHTVTVTGRSPETAKQAYYNSRNYINTWNSPITVPDYNRFIKREAGVDCGMVIDCQKALETNLAIYFDNSLTDMQKKKMYITSSDFPIDGNSNLNWRNILSDYGINLNQTDKLPFECQFKTYVGMVYAIHNDFNDDTYMPPEIIDVRPQDYTAQTVNTLNYIQYKPSVNFINNAIRDYRALNAMTVDLKFGYARIFPWYVVGEIYPINPVSESVAKVIVANVKEALRLYFAPANRSFGQKPTVMEVVEVIQNADSHIRYFDAGSLVNPVINYGEKRLINGNNVIVKFDVEYFNPISFAKYQDVGLDQENIRVANDWIIR